MHGLLCAYLNLLECIAGYAWQSLTATFSILGREVAPKSANLSVALCQHGVRTDCVLNYFRYIIHGNVLRCIIVCIFLEATLCTTECCLIRTVFSVNVPTFTASLRCELWVDFFDRYTVFLCLGNSAKLT